MIGARPTLAQVQSTVGSEQWLAALALANLSDDVRKDLARWTAWGDCGTYTYDGHREWKAADEAAVQERGSAS